MTTHDKVDAIIVGAGAGGGCVAKQLATAGLKCVLLERGGWHDYEESTNDELINQRTHAIRSLHGPDVAKHGEIGRKSWIPLSADIAACVGSGTVTYGAMGWRFMPQDFKLKTLYPEIKDSALADWPITYDELEPFYQQAEYEVGVSGDMSTNPFAPPRKKPFPMPAFEYNREDADVIIPAMKRLGLHPFPIPMLRNSVRYNGRAACQRNHTCSGYACPCDAKNGTQNTVIPVAMKTGNCEVRTNSLAYEVVMKGRRAIGVKYFDDERGEHFQPADIVVVAANARETSKLLFMSKSELFPTGLGNQNDMVGRCINSHVYCGA
ncbi:MAG: GMC family oxidoreductase, partial [Opitutales bacterium]|nr:GMC family oxidoreductase [Opitutales bacterium]